MKKNIATIILFPVVVIALTMLTACGVSEEELILRDNIKQMRNAVSQHQADIFMSFVDKNYKSPFHRDKKALQKFVEYHLDNNRVIYTYIADIEIEIDDNIAKVIFYSGTTGGADQIPERGQLYKVGMHWLKADGQWLLTQAKWRPALVLNKK